MNGDGVIYKIRVFEGFLIFNNNNTNDNGGPCRPGRTNVKQIQWTNFMLHTNVSLCKSYVFKKCSEFMIQEKQLWFKSASF